MRSIDVFISYLKEVLILAARLRLCICGVFSVCSILIYNADSWPSFSNDTVVIDASLDSQVFCVL